MFYTFIVLFEKSSTLIDLMDLCKDFIGISQVKYTQITGSLMFLTTYICFDIAYDVGKLYTHNLRVEH
jgi:hypothetical protein